MGLLDKLKGIAQSDTVKGWLPEPKVAAAAASSGAVAVLVWAAGKRGYRIPRKNVEKVITSAVGLAVSIPPVVAYLKASPQPVAPATFS